MHTASPSTLNKTLLASSIALSLANSYAFAAPPTFTSININSFIFSTTNYAATGSLNNDSTGVLNSIDPFFYHTWTASQETGFLDNTGSFSGTSLQGPFNYNAEISAMTTDQIAVGMFFNWSGTNETAILEIFDCIPETNICQGQGVPMNNGPYSGSSAMLNSSSTLICKDKNLTIYGFTSESILLADLYNECFFINGTPALVTFDTVSSNGSSIIVAGDRLIYTGLAGIEGQDTFSVTVRDDANSYTFDVVIFVSTVQQSNFTIQNASGNTFAGTNDVTIDWDEFSFNSSSDDGSGNGIPVDTGFGLMTISSPTPFLNYKWYAHHIRIFEGPGTFKFDVTCTATDYDSGIVDCNNPLAEQGASEQYITMTLNAGDIGGHILFDWGQTNVFAECGVAICNTDVINVWKQNDIWETHGDGQPKNMLWIGEAGLAPDMNTIWGLTSIDGDGDGVNGVQMIDGAFPLNSINFNYYNNLVTEGCELFGLVTDAETGECIEEANNTEDEKENNEEDDKSSSALNLTYLIITTLLLLGRKGLNLVCKTKQESTT